MDLPFSIREYKDRQRRVREGMERAGLDALVCFAPDNLFYLSAYDTIGYLWYQALVVLKDDDRVSFLTRTTEEPGVWATSMAEDARLYDIQKQDPVQVTVDILKERASARAVVGVEKQAFNLAPAEYERLVAALGKDRVRDASYVVGEVRLEKSPLERQYQQKAARIADVGMEAAITACQVGATEVEIGGIIQRAMAEEGGEYQAIQPMVCSGPRSIMIHGMGTRRALEPGDVAIIEHAGVYCRYHAVVMRTVSIGEPTRRVREVCARLREALDAAQECIRPGVAVGEPERVCTEVLDRGGLGLSRFRAHRLGYSLGISYPPTWLEAMFLVPEDRHTFAPHMSFTMEPNLSFVQEGFGIKLGDTVRATEQGAESLSLLSRDLVVVEP